MGKKSRRLRAGRPERATTANKLDTQFANNMPSVQEVLASGFGEWILLCSGLVNNESWIDIPLSRAVVHRVPHGAFDPLIICSTHSHPRSAQCSMTSRIVDCWNRQQWFVDHKDGDDTNDALDNLRVVELDQALSSESSDVEFFLSEDERALTRNPEWLSELRIGVGKRI